MLRITLADYGVGNLHSLKKALELCGAEVEVASDMNKLLYAECIAFPGVGAFDRTMERLVPIKDELCARLETGTPAIGICVGTQILFDSSEEGITPGIGFIKGNVVKLRAKQIPHTGWNTVNSYDPMFESIRSPQFYFTHSYYCSPSDEYTIKGTTEYEEDTYPTFFRKMNTVGTQFHPEKSSRSGLAFLSNFVRFAESCL